MSAPAVVHNHPIDPADELDSQSYDVAYRKRSADQCAAFVTSAPAVSHSTVARSSKPPQKNDAGSRAVVRKYLRRLRDAVACNKGATKEAGRRWNSILILGFWLLLFVTSFLAFVLVRFTDIYNNRLYEQIKLAPGSYMAEMWEKPPVSTELRVHIFNYTNAAEWAAGKAEKLKLAEIGPYVYRERFEKANVVYNANHTISYKENRSIEFRSELSVGHQFDSFTLPDMQGIVVSKYNFFTLTKPSLFQDVTVNQLLWAMEPSTLTRIFAGPEKFGVLLKRKGVSQDTYTIHTGVDDIRKLALVNRFSGQSSLNYWSTAECNRIDGTDGSQFPPHSIDKKTTLYIYASSFCRRFPLNFAEEVTILDGIPVWRYKAPLDVFAHPDLNKANECYCDRADSCPPSGVFDVSKCFGAPILLSSPHFLNGSPELFAPFEGLQPVEDRHRSFADIHPRMAFPIGGASRIQINIQAPVNVFDVHNSSRFTKKLILPVLWMELGSGDIAEGLRANIYHSTFSANAIELSITYGSLLVCILSLLVLVVFVPRLNRRTGQQQPPPPPTTRWPTLPIAASVGQPVDVVDVGDLVKSGGDAGGGGLHPE